MQTIPRTSGAIFSPHNLSNSIQAIGSLIAKHALPDKHLLQELLQELTTEMLENIKMVDEPESRLTCRKFPLEVAYVWPSNSFRVTSDLAPGSSPEKRIQLSLQKIGPLQHTYQSAWIQLFKDWIRLFGGRYGAWIGSRCKEQEFNHKIYLEIAPKSPWRKWEAEQLGVLPLASQHRLVMVGLNPISGESEFYYRTDYLNVPGLSPLFKRHGLPDRSSEVIGLLRQLTPGHIRFEVPSSNLGYSVAYSKEGRATALTLYSVADSLLGGDAMIRAYSLNLGKRMNWDMSFYEESTLGLAENVHLENSWHGMLGIVAPASGPLQYTLGWTPPVNPPS